MKTTSTPLRHGTAVVALASAALLPVTAAAQTPNSGQWQYMAAIYAFLPSIDGTTHFPTVPGGGGGSGGSGDSSINVSSSDLIGSLKMTFMGSFDVHNGRWGMFNDVLYLDVGGSKSQTRNFTIGSIGLPASATADLKLDLKGWIWTVAGEYRVASDPQFTMDVLAGARYFDVKQKLGWSLSGDIGPITGPGRSGNVEVSGSVWDGIVGVKGRYAFGADRKWSVPYYLDIGTGQSDRTWQAAVGLAYSYQWGEVIGMWRYLDYSFKSDKHIEDFNFNGPMIGAAFRW